MRGQPHVEQLVQPTRSEHGWVNDVWPVCGGHEVDLFAGLQTVHLCEQLVHHTGAGTALEVEGEGRGGEGRGGEGRGVIEGTLFYSNRSACFACVAN